MAYFYELRKYCYAVAASHQLVLFMTGTPTQPGDFSSAICIKILKAAGANISLFKATGDPVIQKDSGVVQMKGNLAFFDVSNNGSEYADLFKYGLKGIKVWFILSCDI